MRCIVTSLTDDNSTELAEVMLTAYFTVYLALILNLCIFLSAYLRYALVRRTDAVLNYTLWHRCGVQDLYSA